MNEFISVFKVTDFFSKKSYMINIKGFGDESIQHLRKEYPKFSKFVLKGFNINGTFVELNLKTFNSVR
jgi:hypothetical protein